MIAVRRANIRIIIVCFFLSYTSVNALSSLARNDPYPVFSSLDPHTFLYTHEKLKIIDPEFAKLKRDNVGISLSPFGQNADRGRDFRGRRVELGDLMGRWDMLALLYGPIPPGRTMAPTLQTALTNLFPGVAVGDLNDPTKIDPNENFGFFSIPIEYRKRGVRVVLQGDIYAGFGISLETGVVSMTQTVTGFIDLTPCIPTICPFNPAPLTPAQIETFLMSQLQTIAAEINLDIGNFCATSIEEVRVNLFWRRAFELNGNEEDWPHFLLMPFFVISGTVSPGTDTRLTSGGLNKAFATPFGNNTHTGIGFTTGLDIDFVESIELGAEVGMTFWFKRNFEKFRLPTSESQLGIYPFFTDVEIRPGLNWHFGGKIAAYHFLDRLSAWLQYIQMQHCADDINLRKCEDEGIFLPQAFEELTAFKAKFINVGLNYDISPNISLGLFWQAPLSQQNTYRSSTVMFSFNATF